jgi:chromosome transmission fidelity protein 4
MLALREVHAQGATRVSINGHHLLTGGLDGVVSFFSIKQWPKAAPIWSFKCHEGAVTDVVLADALELALSCGRDGRILLHENIFDATKLVSRVTCQVTGEVRCLQLDVERRRVYIAGDSLRCLDMAQDRFKIHTIPLIVPFPIVSLAVSPCGRFVAMASASGELGVVDTPPVLSSSTAAAAAGAGAMTPPSGSKTRLLFQAVLSATAKKDDAACYRMSWCSSQAGGLMLMVPTATEVQVFQLKEGGETTQPSASSTPAVRMRSVGGLHDRQLTDLHGAIAYCVTKNRLACVMASRAGLFIGKVEAKGLAMSRHTSELYDTTTGHTTAVTDVQVNPVSGDVAVGLSDGRVSLLRKASLKEWRSKTTSAKVFAEARKEDNTLGGEVHKTDAPQKAGQHHRRGADGDEEECESFIHDGSDSDDEDSASESSADSSSDSDESSADSSDSGVAPEDFGKVVVDLQRSGASLRDNDEERPSRWRGSDAEAALAHAEREAERQRTRSRFLDDEAEEGSAEDDEDGDDDDEDAHGGAGRKASRYRRGDNGGDEEEEEGEEDHYDNASVEGQAEDGEEGHPSYSAGRGASGTTRLLASSRVPAVQDYSFQVCATPAGEEGSCYLAYNSVGYIHCSREATTVHFHDISYPAVRLQLRGTILMGSLSPVGAGFVVVPAEPSDAQGSVDEAPRLTVFYHAFTPLGAQSEWRVALLPGETVRCMAAGIRYLAVATSHYLRIFSLSGLELAVLSKCQRIVTMVGTSSRKLMSSFKADFDPLAIITLTGTGELQMEVIDVGARTAALPARTIPLTELPDGSTHQLQWLGWSEDGLLHTADTAGVVRMFTEDWGGSWVPVYDPRMLVDQSYALWVYGVSDNALLAYRYSRDDPSYPAAAASGLSTELVPLFLPLTRTMGEEGRERWDKVLRQQIRCDELKRHSAFYSATIAKYDEVHDHHLLQFFDSALKEQQTTRALELAMLLEIHDRIVRCAQMANNSGYTKLVPKLLALYEMRMAAKSRRRCTLPTKETMVSEKKKDEVLRKLLGQVLPQESNKRGKADEPPATEGGGTSAGNAVTVGDNEERSRQAGQERRDSSPTSTTFTMTATQGAVVKGTSPSAASTATTIDTASTARRHISFAREVRPSRTPATAATTNSASNAAVVAPSLSQASSTSTTSTNNVTSGAAPAGPRKVLNPFARPSSAATAATFPTPVTPAGNGPVVAAAAEPSHQKRLDTITTLSAVSSPPPASKHASLLGGSQCSTPPRTMVGITAASGSQPERHPSTPAQQRDGDDAATSGSSLGGTPEERRVSAGHAADSPRHPTHDEHASTVSKPPTTSATVAARPTTLATTATTTPTTTTAGFIARELPTHTSVSSGPVDPFLVDANNNNAYKTAPSVIGIGLGPLTGGGSDSGFSAYSRASLDVPTVSVQSLLDVGHDETAPVVRSDSFGEALRKRYREDDDAEEDAWEAAPRAAVPKLSP